MNLNPLGSVLLVVSAVIVFGTVFYAMLCFGETRHKRFAYIAMALAFPSLIILFVALSHVEPYI